MAGYQRVSDGILSVIRQVPDIIAQIRATQASVQRNNPQGVDVQEMPPGAVSIKDMNLRKVPVVSWAKAGDGGNFSDCADQINEGVATDCKDPNAYALIIEGDSMEPRYCAGDRAIFMPNTEPQNGNKVVARLMENGEVYFKIYHRTGKKGERVKLTSLNPAYPPFEHPANAFRFIHPMHTIVRK